MNVNEVVTPLELLSTKARRGKWTAEEERFVGRIIEDFNLGILDVPQGTTLRNFLSSVLNCDPMRITKKYTGNSSIGKRAFMKADEGSIGMEYIQMRRQELQHFKLEWYRYLNDSNRTASKKARTLTYGSSKGLPLGPNSLLDMKLASCSSTAEFGELNMNPSITYEHVQNISDVHKGSSSSSSVHQPGALRANCSYDQLVDLDPTCNLGIRQGQDRILELEKSISRIPSSLLHHSMVDLESASSFGLLNPSASLASLPSLGNTSREDLNALLLNSRQSSTQNFSGGNLNPGPMIANSESSTDRSAKAFYEYLVGKIGVGDDNLSTTTAPPAISTIQSKKRLFQNDEGFSIDESSYSKHGAKIPPNTSDKSLDDATSRESAPYCDSNDNEDISDIEKIVIERSAGLLMKMC